MTSKTISVTSDVYNLLRKMRLPGESFGETIARLCRSKTSVSLCLWATSSDGWSDLTSDEEARLEETLERIHISLQPEEVDLK
ncbi:MAG: antitoxin VapB family protein [Candidatus Thorarchaeota archaeon]|nr:antitoxin VapB family protein [Candidatus Thorarchaeota archaeon]